MLIWHSLCIYTMHYRDCTGPLKRSAALQCYPMPSVSWTMETIPGEREKQKHWKNTEQKTCASEATGQRSKENRETHLIWQQHAFIYSVKNSVEKQQFIKREWVVSNAHLRLRDGEKRGLFLWNRFVCGFLYVSKHALCRLWHIDGLSHSNSVLASPLE